MPDETQELPPQEERPSEAGVVLESPVQDAPAEEVAPGVPEAAEAPAEAQPQQIHLLHQHPRQRP
jgi:hypothetical protein